ncbi:MAG: type IV pili methyl-accepting chemotaxis transducer N-terminal domain-containing protein [Trinickia sp.]|uniref:type IV pili methyl-accepting chemotaxis transducer N-terminal domain-containing protein n=1 Tax=Trinickia sp. TaxID=2571163 RepID=UPI003F81563D
MIKHESKDVRRALENHVSAETIGELINLAGRQRMLSQRIVLHVLLAAQGDTGASQVAKECLAMFAAAHADLVDGSDRLPGVFCDALSQLYFGSHRADERIRRFIGDATHAVSQTSASEREAQAFADALVAQASPLLQLLQEITLAYQNEMRNVEHAASKRDAQLAEQLGRISMQANIVAINARISAGRAGPYGREFAVVTSLLSDIVKEMERMVHGVMTSRGASPRVH